MTTSTVTELQPSDFGSGTWVEQRVKAKRKMELCYWGVAAFVALILRFIQESKIDTLTIDSIISIGWLPALLLCIGVSRFFVTEVRHFEKHTLRLTFKQRIQESGLWFIFGVIGIITAYFYSRDQLNDFNALMLSWIVIFTPIIVYGGYKIIRPTRTVLTANGLRAKTYYATAIPESNTSTNNEDNFLYDAPWWLRYPLGIGFLSGSYYLLFESNKKFGWVFSILFGIAALGLMREILIFTLVFGFLALIFWLIASGISALPISAAIIIGAIIIAMAIKR